MIVPRRLRCACALVPLAGAGAQELLWTREGVEDQYQLGARPIQAIGDIDKDGYEDLVATAVAWDPATNIEENELHFLSGKDGRTLRVRKRYEQGGGRPYTWTARAGDVDGDGDVDYAVAIVDITTGGNRPTIVEVRRARDDKLLWAVNGSTASAFGWGIASDMDLDGDKRPDLVVFAPYEGWHGAVHAFSSQGKLLWRRAGDPQVSFSTRPIRPLARFADLDRDGRDDVATGAVEWGVASRPVVLSGRSGAVLLRVTNPLPTETLDRSVAGCCDLDGDGVADLLAGSEPIFRSVGAVVAWSGRTGQVIRQWVSTTTLGIAGEAMEPPRDVDGDGVADLIVGGAFGDSNQGIGAIHVFSGRDGKQIARLTEGPNPPPTSTFGLGAPLMAPHPGHPSPIVLTADTNHGWYQSKKVANAFRHLGKIFCLRISPQTVVPHGDPCAGALPAAPRMGLREHWPGNGLRVNLSAAPPGAGAVLMLGLSRASWGGIPLPLALDPFGFPACKLRTSVELALPVWTGTSGNDRGYGFVDLPWPLRTQAPFNFELNGQWLVLDPSAPLRGGATQAWSWRH